MKLTCSFDDVLSEVDLDDKQEALLNEIAVQMNMEPSEACINLLLDYLEMHEAMRYKLPKRVAN